MTSPSGFFLLIWRVERNSFGKTNKRSGSEVSLKLGNGKVILGIFNIKGEQQREVKMNQKTNYQLMLNLNFFFVIILKKKIAQTFTLEVLNLSNFTLFLFKISLTQQLYFLFFSYKKNGCAI